MKKYTPFVCLLALLCLLFYGCGSKNTLSEGAQAVLDATMNTPNTELFDPGLLISPDMDGEEKARIMARQEEFSANWENLLGQYFSPGSFDLFLNSYIRTMFLVDDPIPSQLVSAELVSRNDTQEVVEAQVDIDGEVKPFKITFLYNPDGLFYRVEIEEIY